MFLQSLTLTYEILVLKFFKEVVNVIVMDKSSVCRLCGTGEGIKFKIFDPRRDYISKIHQLLPIMIHEQDPWPKLICHRCAFKLQEFYDFREICIKTDSYLKTQGSAPVQQKAWEQPAAPSSWVQSSVNTNSVSSAGLQFKEPVRIKQEVPIDEPPPMVTPHRPVVQEPPPQMVLMPSPALHQQYVPIAQQPPATATVPPMVQFNQKIAVKSSPKSVESRTNAVYLNPGEGDCFLPEGPDEAQSESSEDDRQRISDRESNQRSTGTRRSTGSGRKQKRTLSDPSYRTNQGHKRKQSNCRSRVSVKQAVATNVGQAAPRYKPGPKSFKSLQQLQNRNESQTTDISVKLESDNQKEGRRPGPKSRVGIRESDDSDVSFVLSKTPNRVLDTIDITEESDESESNSNRAGGLPSHILLTKIPGMCNIFTCMLCECTITSKKCMLEHLCSRVSEGRKRGRVIEEQDNAGEGFYKCDVCGMTFTRHVTLVAHKEKHLYNMSDSDSVDSLEALRGRRKKIYTQDE